MENTILTITDLSELTGWSKSYIYRLTSNNTLPFYKPNGKTLFFEKAEILKWLLRNRNKTKEEMQETADDFVNQKRAAI